MVVMVFGEIRRLEGSQFCGENGTAGLPL